MFSLAVCFAFTLLVVAADSDVNSEPINYFNGLNKVDARIVGGSTARPGQFPYQASFLNSNNQIFCGGAIIDRNFILTAANCFQRVPTRNVRVLVGSVRRSGGHTVHAISAVAVHPQFNSSSLENNIAVVRTVHPIQLNTRFIQGIRLAGRPLPLNAPAVVTGWGQLSHNPAPGVANPLPETLQFKVTWNLDLQECTQRLGARGKFIDESNICTNNPPRRGLCLGDAGGPLVSYDNELVGIASWAVLCGTGVPDVYTNVISYIPWITRAINWR